MKANTKLAVAALNAINAPVYDHLAGENGCEFIIGAELRDNNDVLFADYYQTDIREAVVGGKITNAFGVRQDVTDILEANGLWSEWVNPGQLAVYQA
jgi:hypothetical protein